MYTKNYFLEFNKTLIFKEPMKIMKTNQLESLSLLIPLHLLFFPFIFIFWTIPIEKPGDLASKDGLEEYGGTMMAQSVTDRPVRGE